MIEKIYLHWSATHYDWREPGHYHSVIDGDGHAWRLTPYRTPLYAHTYARNTNAVGIAMACMGGSGWADYPPTEEQIDGLAKEAAKVAVGLGWPADAKALKKLIMTHAEAAANRDYPIADVRDAGTSDAAARALGLPHGNYGPGTWSDGWPGGTVERWDLWQLRPTDRGGAGGFEIRERIAKWMREIKK